MRRTRLERTINQLKKNLEFAKFGKKRILDYVERIKNKCLNKEIHYYEYEQIIHKKIDGKNIQEWLDYYDNIIYTNEKRIERVIRRVSIKQVLLIISFITLILFSLFFNEFLYNQGKEIFTTFTSLVIQEKLDNTTEEFPSNISNESIGVSEDKHEVINETNISKEPPPSSESEISDEIFPKIPEEEVNETINETIVNETAINETFDNITIINDTLANETLINKTFSETIVNFTSNITINITTLQYKAIINKPTKWIKTIKINNAIENLRVELPKDAKNISIKTGREITEALNELESYDEIIENSDKNHLIYGITGNVALDIKNNRIKDNQGILTKLWNLLSDLLKSFTLTGNVIQENELTEEIIETEDKKIIDLDEIINQTQADEIAVEYYTEGPISTEEETSIGKRVIVSSPEEINYKDVLAHTQIKEILNIGEENKIKVYWIEENILINFSVSDLDNNSKIDYIEWNVSHLSNQSFDIILITKAEHLDENKIFIEDIYEEVKELDENWSLIPNKDYVRVTFEKNLTNENDISIYLRVVNGNPKIDVYEINGTEIIAEFNDLKDNEYNKAFLDGSSGAGLGENSQDTFDLRVIHGNIEINHIIDPTINVNSASGDIALAPLNDTTLVIAWANNSNNGIFFKIVTTSGTVVLGPTKVDQLTDYRRERVSLASINSTAFAIGWYNITSADEMRATYKIDGTSTTGKTRTDGEVGTNFWDNSLSSLGNTIYVYCYIDTTEADADAYMVNSTTNAIIGIEKDIDAAMGPATNLSNLFDCVAINSTSYAVIFFDDADNDATIATGNKLGLGIINATDVDVDVGEISAVEVTQLDDNKFVAIWFSNGSNGPTPNITATVRDAKNNVIKAVSRLVINPGNWTSLASATIANGSSGEYFALIWANSTASNTQLLASVFNASLDIATPMFVVDSNFHKRPLVHGAYPVINAIGKNINGVPSLCNGTFAVAYTNFTNSTILKTYYINGSIWDGTCGGADTTFPSINITFPTTNNSNTSDTSLDVNFTVSDDIALAECWYSNDTYLVNKSTEGCGVNVTNITWSEGLHNITIYVNDTLNNVNFSTISFRIDTTAPDISITNPSSNNTVTTDTLLDINFTVSDNIALGECWYSNDTYLVNKSTGGCGVNVTNITWSEGLHNITIYVNDTSNNVNFSTRSFRIDTIFPLIDFINPSPGNATSTSNVSVLINVSIIEKNLNEVKWNWNGTNYTLFNDSLVLFMNLDNRSSLEENDTFIVDLSGNKNHGIGKFGVKVNITDCRYRNCFTFDGKGALGVGSDGDLTNDNMIFINDSDSTSIKNMCNKGCSISAWIKVRLNNSGGGRGYIVTRYDSSNNDRFFYFRVNSTSGTLDSVFFSHGNPSGAFNSSSVSVSSIITTDVWIHVATTFNGTNTTYGISRLYVNGTLKGTGAGAQNMTINTTAWQDNEPILIGNLDFRSPFGPFNGSIDDVRIYNYPLNETEIYQLYISNLYSYNSTQWYLLVNQSKNTTDGLDVGSYTYYTSSKDKAGNENLSETRSVTIASVNNPPEIRYMDNATMTNVAGGLSAGPLNTSVIINFSVYDADGAGNLNNASARINFTRAGEAVRQNYSCMQITSDGGNNANYSCNVTMMWFDSSGTWNIIASINDSDGNNAINISANFSVGETVGVGIGGLSWASLAPGTTNQTTGEGLLLNNTGNKAIPINATQINATNLRGEVTSSLAIWAGNISVSWNTSVASCHSSGGNGTKANNLSAGNYVNVSGANLSRGNYLLNDNSTGQERLYFCIKIVGSDLTAQSYSTLNESSWTIQILLAPLAYFGRRKKNRKNRLFQKRKEKSKEKLLEEISSLVDELKDKKRLSKEKTAIILINEIKKKYKIDREEIIKLAEISIPISIFTKNVGILETIAKYMKENLEMSYKEIAEELDRDQRTIWTSYKKAIEKRKEKIEPEETDILLPISIFKNKLTTLESIVIYLKERGMKYSEIAELLNRDQRNIWTIYSRAKIKYKK